VGSAVLLVEHGYFLDVIDCFAVSCYKFPSYFV